MFSVGEKIVYPVHGAGVIESIENREILGEVRSYSVLRITRGAEERVSFTCRNSKVGNKHEEPGGVGLANTRQRLELIYHSDYTLNIDDGEDTYQVNLDIPFLAPEQNKA